jgi:hypothetical protein
MRPPGPEIAQREARIQNLSPLFTALDGDTSTSLENTFTGCSSKTRKHALPTMTLCASKMTR